MLFRSENEIVDQYDIEYRYQLQVEDSELIAQYENLVFVDADLTQHENGFEWKLLVPSSLNSYTSHELFPESILDLTHNIYQKFPKCHTLGISGESFDLKIGMTKKATMNLQFALVFFREKIYK